jgi:tetratricopeptide (TPR) repeat protein
MTDDLASLLAAGERAAFHGRPGAGIEPLQRAVAVAGARDLHTAATAARWLLAVCLSAAGRFGAAIEVLDEVVRVHDEDPVDRRTLAALGGSTLASVHRQLGRHAQARAHDELALTRSEGVGEAAFDALLGLAADAVGLGEREVARDNLESAAALVADRAEWWRQRVRLGWVRAEIALLETDPEAAIEAAGGAVDLAEHSGAPRHVAKGLLFQGVAQIEAGRPEEAAATLRRGALLAESLGTLPLLWPARAVLGALLAGAHRDESARSLDSARRAVDAIAADLPDSLRAGWLARADVAALREQ